MASNELTGSFSALKLSTALPISEDDFLASFNKLQISGPAQRARPQHPLDQARHQINLSKNRLPAAPTFATRREPTNMNWALGYDTLHPLEGHIQSPPPPPPARPYIPKYSVENPSPYYLEQAPFYCDPTIPDPFEHQAEEPEPKRPFEAIFLTIFHFLSHATSSLFSAIVTTLSIILAILSFAFQRGVVGPMEGVQHFVANITVYGIGAFVVALYVAALLPSWKRTAVEVFEESEPLYRIFISGREALGNGPVTSSQL